MFSMSTQPYSEKELRQILDIRSKEECATCLAPLLVGYRLPAPGQLEILKSHKRSRSCQLTDQALIVRSKQLHKVWQAALVTFLQTCSWQQMRHTGCCSKLAA